MCYATTIDISAIKDASHNLLLRDNSSIVILSFSLREITIREKRKKNKVKNENRIVAAIILILIVIIIIITIILSLFLIL